MKNLILTALMLASLSYVNAQENSDSQGFYHDDVFVSGSVIFNSTSTGDNKSNGFTLSPRLGFFVSKNLAFGANASVTRAKSENGLNESTTLGASIGGFSRYYFTPTRKFSFFGQIGAGFNTSKTESGVDETKENGFNISASPGLSYFLTKHFALEASLGLLTYNSRKPDTEGAESSDTFSASLNIENIALGLVYRF